ncbi:hypothetical protein Vretifemale_20308, partial [Volvox reticuliferus]
AYAAEACGCCRCCRARTAAACAASDAAISRLVPLPLTYVPPDFDEINGSLRLTLSAAPYDGCGEESGGSLGRGRMGLGAARRTAVTAAAPLPPGSWSFIARVQRSGNFSATRRSISM